METLTNIMVFFLPHYLLFVCSCLTIQTSLPTVQASELTAVIITKIPNSGKILNGKSISKWKNQQQKHIKQIFNNCHIPDLVQAFFKFLNYFFLSHTTIREKLHQQRGFELLNTRVFVNISLFLQQYVKGKTIS